MKKINPLDFVVRINDLWLNRWFLLTSGDFEKNDFNTMTVAWGFFGEMWNKPIAVIAVRPTRFTFEFTEKYETFSLSSFPKDFKKDLNLLGTKSGRDGDKISETKLNVVPSINIPSPSFKEADLVIECKKIYHDFLKPENFIDPAIEKSYPAKDYHKLYFGEILEIRSSINSINS